MPITPNSAANPGRHRARRQQHRQPGRVPLRRAGSAVALRRRPVQARADPPAAGFDGGHAGLVGHRRRRAARDRRHRLHRRQLDLERRTRSPAAGGVGRRVLPVGVDDGRRRTPLRVRPWRQPGSLPPVDRRRCAPRLPRHRLQSQRRRDGTGRRRGVDGLRRRGLPLPRRHPRGRSAPSTRRWRSPSRRTSTSTPRATRSWSPGRRTTARCAATVARVWRLIRMADGGGVAIDPNNPLRILAQNNGSTLESLLDGGLSGATNARSPILNAGETANMYARLVPSPVAETVSTVLYPTNRIWVSYDWGARWRVLPGNLAPAAASFGRLNGAADMISDVVWSARDRFHVTTGRRVVPLRPHAAPRHQPQQRHVAVTTDGARPHRSARRAGGVDHHRAGRRQPGGGRHLHRLRWGEHPAGPRLVVRRRGGAPDVAADRVRSRHGHRRDTDTVRRAGERDGRRSRQPKRPLRRHRCRSVPRPAGDRRPGDDLLVDVDTRVERVARGHRARPQGAHAVAPPAARRCTGVGCGSSTWRRRRRARPTCTCG